MRTSDQGVAFLAAHEGIVPAPYFDSVGVLTFGVGHTAAAGAPDPAQMQRGMPADVDEAIAYAFEVFRRDLARYEAAVRTVIANRAVAQHEFDAAVSFHFNTGAIARATWVKHWMAGNKAAAALSMMDWRKPIEVKPRREAERDLFLHGRYGAKAAAVWPVNAAGTITWRPVKTLSQAQIVNLVRPSAPPKPAAMPRPVDPRPDAPGTMPPPNAIGWAFTIIAVAIVIAIILGN